MLSTARNIHRVSQYLRGSSGQKQEDACDHHCRRGGGAGHRGGAAAWFLSNRSHADEEEGGAPAAARKEAPKVAPTFLPMENMVVNLADPGGDRFAQIGVTLELEDVKTSDQVKLYLPTIRSGILLLVSQRTSSELLSRDGKEKLAADIRREVSRPLGYAVPKERARAAEAEQEGDGEAEDRPARKRSERNPVLRVLFSNFIIQ
ncbi:flagellar FliL protein [Acidovorax sp. 69]|nr:flagellar FliL protein [Acidovorax sp. 69]